MNAPRLYHLRLSHYNEKVRWALDHKRWPHRRIALVPGLHVPRVRLLSGQERTPVIDLDGRVLHDSTAIIAELERLRPDPALYPADPAQRAEALAIEDHFDEHVAPDLRRLFWGSYLSHPLLCARMSTHTAGSAQRALWLTLAPLMLPVFRRRLGLDAESLARARERLDSHFEYLETRIGPSGFMVGESLTVADLTAASIMTAIVRPSQFPYPLPEPWPPELVELRSAVSHRRGFRWVLDTYAGHRAPSAEIWPDLEG